MKKLFTLFLALVACAGTMFASDTEVDGIWYDFDSTTKTATVTYRGDNSYSYSDEYSGEVVIPSSVTYNAQTYTVTSIGGLAFYNCTGLTSIEIPNSVTSIGDVAFQFCIGLTKVNITDIAAWCNIAFSPYNSNPLSIAKNLYVNDIKVTELVIPNSVTSIGNVAFAGCSSLTSVTIPNSVTSIGNYAFYGCSGLTSVTIPNSVTSIGSWAFYQCTGLTSIEIPNSVTSIGDVAFQFCTGLTSIEIPNSVTSIGGGTFYNCSGLISVTIPNSVTSIGESAFNGCSGLTSVTIPNSVTSIGNYAFLNCSSLTSFDVAFDNPNYSSIDGILFNKDKTVILQYPSQKVGASYNIPNSVTNIGNYAFSYSSLTSIDIPNSVTSIGKSAFVGVPNINYSGSATGSPWGAKSVNGYVDGYLVYSDDSKTILLACSSAAQGEISIPNSVKSIGSSAFAHCSSLTSVTIPNSVTSIGNSAFEYCSGLTSIDIPNSVTGIGDGAFYGCTGLTSVTIPNSVTSIGDYAFYQCSGLTSIEIPNSVTSIGDWAFHDCSNLTSFDVAFDNPNYSSIDGILFNKDKTVILQYPLQKVGTSYNIPNSVTSIGDYAFSGCSGLTSVTIPNSVTSIGKSAFSGCSSLTSVTIPNSVTSIGYAAFSSCSSLTSITNYATTPQSINSDVFYNVKKFTCVLNVPKESVSLYQAAEVWREFTNIVGVDVPDVPTSAPEVYTNPSNPAQKLIRNGNVYILTDDKIYTIQGDVVK